MSGKAAHDWEANKELQKGGPVEGSSTGSKISQLGDDNTFGCALPRRRSVSGVPNQTIQDDCAEILQIIRKSSLWMDKENLKYVHKSLLQVRERMHDYEKKLLTADYSLTTVNL